MSERITLEFTLREIRDLQCTLAYFKGKSDFRWHNEVIQLTLNKILEWDRSVK